MQKKGQLGWIEFKYFMGGLAIGLVVFVILMVLGNSGVIPFKLSDLSFLCPVGAA